MAIHSRHSSHIRRAALLGILVVALAHLAPLHLAQKLNGVLLGRFADTFPLGPDGSLVLLDLNQPESLAALSSASTATIVGPSSLAIGPLVSPAWGEAGAWFLAIGAVIALLLARKPSPRVLLLLGVVGPLSLLGASGTAFSAAGIWIPIAGPALLLLTTGATALAGGNRSPVQGLAAAAEPDSARGLFDEGRYADAWAAYRALPPVMSLVPELFNLAEQLAAEGYSELAADTYLRIALVDSDYRDVTSRLIRVARPEEFANADASRALRERMPATLGRYRLLEPIGKGTTGRVYLAKDPHINRLVAIKLIDLTLERDNEETVDAMERFRREAETAGRLSHPNIVTIYDMGDVGGNVYIAMEYLNGHLLSRYTDPDMLLPPALVLELGARTADALDYAHSQNVVHRDIKPSNIMYDSVGDDLKITDFGIARLIDVNRTRTGVVLGTPSFMAPEQIEGGNVKGHTDLFALGVTLYELLTGHLPFRGTSMTKLMFVIANEPHEPVSAVRPSLPRQIDPVIDMALTKDPAARYGRGRDMAEALREVARSMA